MQFLKTTRSCVAVLAVLCAFSLVGGARADMIYVDDDAPNDPGPGDPTISDPLEDGSTGHPFDAIQEGIDAAVDDDEVVVLDGTYTGTGNRDLDFGGKAITVRSESGPATCVIDCQQDGRGFYFSGGETAASVVNGFTICNGRAGYGGGIYCYSSSPTVANCTITGNTALDGFGGGIYCEESGNPTVTNCTITANTARDGYGGGVYCWNSSPAIANCAISSNVAHYGGGGVCCDDSGNPVVTNCTILANTAPNGSGGAVDCWGSSPTITNSILWSNRAFSDNQINVSYGSPTVSSSCIEGGWPGDGNICLDPGFAFEGDPHLMPGSPCIDAGTNDPAGGLPIGDLDGNSRPLDGDGDSFAVADMGAYEFNPDAPSIALSASTMEILAPVGGPNPEGQLLEIRNCGGGTLDWEILQDCSWFQAAPSSGSSTGEIVPVTISVDTTGMAHGQYECVLTVSDAQAVNHPRAVLVVLHVYMTVHVPTDCTTIQEAIDTTSRDHDLVLVADGTYMGPGNRDLDFGGKNITVRSENGPANCIIDCENAGRGFHFHSGEGPTAIVDGFTITNGSAVTGGGIYCYDHSSPTIMDCTLTANTATALYEDGGGGICCRNFSSPTITNSTISGNHGTWGGGIYCEFASSPVISQCSIIGNTAFDGGGIHCQDFGTPTISDCTITANDATSVGGGVMSCHSSGLTITHCVITANTAHCGAGVSCEDTPNVTIANCAITGNSSSANGGGVGCISSNATIVECTITENTAVGGGGIRCVASSPVIANCTIAANAAFSGGGGVSCAGGNPTITNCMITSNSAGRGGGFRCAGGNPTITNCTITSNSAYWDGGAGGLCKASCNATIINCTFAGNLANEGRALKTSGAAPSTLEIANCILWNGGNEIWNEDESTFMITHSDVFGGWPGVGTIDADPLFVDPDGPDDIPKTLDDDFRLSPGSPCIDAADSTAVPPDVADLDGDLNKVERTPLDLGFQPRFVDDADTEDTGVADPPDYPEVVDMGAYEYQGGAIMPALDIKPGSCPNSFNRHSHGVLPAALLGTADIDATAIDVSSILLARADGIGGSVAPHEGPPGPHSVFEDVGTPFDGEWCDCHDLEGDGITDLMMHFKTDDVVDSLELESLPPGDLVELVVSGNLLDGTAFTASDCIRLVPPGTAPGLLYIESSPSGAWIDASPLDQTLDGGGFADFERTYPLTTVVTLTAGMSMYGQPFMAWRIDGVIQGLGENTIQLVVDGNVTVEAVYGRVPVPMSPPRMGTESPHMGPESP